MSDEHAHDASGPAEGEYTDADHADGQGVVHHGAHAAEAEGEYTDGVYSADGREVHHPHHGEGAYTDTEGRVTDVPEEDEGEYTDGRYPDDDGRTGRTDAGRS